MTDRQQREAFEQAIRLLTPREHSELELRQKLQKRQIAGDVIESVITRLKELDYLSNERFTEIYVLQRTRKGDGPLKIIANLRRRGIDDQLIAKYLSRDEDHWLVVAKEVLNKRYGDVLEHGTTHLSREARKRCYTFLNGRGFPGGVISKSLNGTNT